MVKMVMQIFKSDSIRHNGHRKKRFGTVDTVGTVGVKCAKNAKSVMQIFT